MKIRVYYEDTDCGGVVYHSNYLNFCERARSEFFFEKGISPHSEKAFFVVKKIEADYIQPAVFKDELTVTTKLINMKSASLQIEQIIYRDKKPLFKAIITLAYLENMRPKKIPENFKKLFKELV